MAKKPKPKPTDEERIAEILQMIIAGAQFHDLKQHAAENGWGMSEEKLSQLVDAAYAAMAKQLAGTREERLALHLARRETLYAHAVRGGDYSTALAALRDHAALLGMYPATKKGESRPQTNISVIIEQQRTRVIDAAEQLPAIPQREE